LKLTDLTKEEADGVKSVQAAKEWIQGWKVGVRNRRKLYEDAEMSVTADTCTSPSDPLAVEGAAEGDAGADLNDENDEEENDEESDDEENDHSAHEQQLKAESLVPVSVRNDIDKLAFGGPSDSELSSDEEELDENVIMYQRHVRKLRQHQYRLDQFILYKVSQE
jgi:hypothetical protein